MEYGAEVYSFEMKRHELTLEQKVSLIKDNSDGNGLSVRKLAEKYAISKSSVANILNRRGEYQHDYLTNSNKDSKRKLKDETGKHVDEVLFEWFTAQRAKHIPISGPLLQEKARQIAEELGNLPGEFKASNGWLEKFRKRHLILHRQISGESASVNTVTTEEWKNRLPNILRGYNDDDVYNADETGLLFKALPDKSLVVTKDQCKGGKRSKERYTILLCSNWTGSNKLKPLVIGKTFFLFLEKNFRVFSGRSRKPRCFKNVNVDKLPVVWRANKTAWMNANLFAEWLKEVDASMKKNSRHILLFLDNAPCHPIDVQLSNVKLVFFPPNTTSVVQPLDQGVIHSFKCFYRQMLVKHIIAQCTVAHSYDQITVTALDACRWIDLAWNKVTTTTISNTFHKAGFSHMSSDRQSTNDNISPVNEDEDPIKQLEDLLFHVDVSSNRMSAVELVSIDSDIPVFNEWTDESDAIRQMAEVHIIDEMDNMDEEDSIEEVVPKLPEALDMLRKLHLFASTEHPELHSLLSELESKMTDVYLDWKSSKQSCITDYFKQSWFC